jgi:hypothetical protein
MNQCVVAAAAWPPFSNLERRQSPTIAFDQRRNRDYATKLSKMMEILTGASSFWFLLLLFLNQE